MSMVGYLWMSAESLTVNPLRCARELAAQFEATELFLARLGMTAESAATIEQIRDGTGAHVGIYRGSLNEILFKKSSWEEIEAAWLEPLALTITFGGEYWKSTDRCIREGVPESVRGSFVPAGITCVAGWHEVTDALDDRDGPLGRYRFSVRMMGHGWPNQTDACREAILKLDCIKEIQRHVEQVAGKIVARVCFN